MPQKIPTCKLSVTLSFLLKWFSKFVHSARKRMKFATNSTQHYPPHVLRHVATLPSETKNSFFADIQHMWKKMQTRCILIASSFATFSPYWLQIHFPCHCTFTYLLLRSICGIGNSSQQTSLQCLSTINMVFSNKEKILIKKYYLQSIRRKTRYFKHRKYQNL